MDQTLFLQRSSSNPSGFTNQPEIQVDSNIIVPFIRIDSAISTTTSILNHITIELEKPDSYTYLPGEVIQGIVRVEPPASYTKKRVDIHLACSFRETCLNSSKRRKRSIFKVILNPIWLPKDIHQAPFSIHIPFDLPAYNNGINDEYMHGKIYYKIKAVYEYSADVHLSLYPKATLSINISAQISTADLSYNIPMQAKKQISMTIPKDVTLKNTRRLKKGEKGNVSAHMHLRETCFMPGQNIRFSLRIEHFAPVKQNQGIQMILERITRIQQKDGSDALDTQVVHEIISPFVCDPEDCSASIMDVFPIPKYIPPTVQVKEGKIRMPFHIQYRLKALINVDMQHFSEDSFSLRKRDRAYSMVTKVIGSLWQDGPAFFYGTTIELDFPITIGTTTTKILHQDHNVTNNSRKVSYCSKTSIQSLNNLFISSPIVPTEDESSLTSGATINRVDSDPSFNRTTSSYHSVMQQQLQYLSTPNSFFSGNNFSGNNFSGNNFNGNNFNVGDSDNDGGSDSNSNSLLIEGAPPSAPSLEELQKDDSASPPPYFT